MISLDIRVSKVPVFKGSGDLKIYFQVLAISLRIFLASALQGNPEAVPSGDLTLDMT